MSVISVDMEIFDFRLRYFSRTHEFKFLKLCLDLSHSQVNMFVALGWNANQNY
jgi:hypothetical protein